MNSARWSVCFASAMMLFVSGAGGETRFAQTLENAKLITPDGKERPFTEALKVNPGDTIVVPERNFSRSRPGNHPFMAANPPHRHPRETAAG